MTYFDFVARFLIVPLALLVGLTVHGVCLGSALPQALRSKHGVQRGLYIL
jgi:hypothetical protein